MRRVWKLLAHSHLLLDLVEAGDELLEQLQLAVGGGARRLRGRAAKLAGHLAQLAEHVLLDGHLRRGRRAQMRREEEERSSEVRGAAK